MEARYSLPNEKGYSQPNKDNRSGNIFATYNINLEDGGVRTSAQVKKLLTDADNVDFAGYAGSMVQYGDALTGDLFAISDKAFRADANTPLGTYTESTTGTEPDSGNAIMDSAYFDSLVLVSEATDIKAWNGSTWSSWWTGTLGASALTTGTRHLMEVGADGNLYVTDLGNKLYKVNTSGSETLSGAGTLDFSATNYRFTALESNSTRLWIGTEDLSGEEAIIIEWDMAPNSNTANRLHKVGAQKVMCIAIWNDTPIAILSNGQVKYFNGDSFVNFDKSIMFPVEGDAHLDEDFIHPNGWAIIDDLPHFLVSGRTRNATIQTSVVENSYSMPSGVWCLNPSIGLYHRFALGTGESTQEDYGKICIKEVGFLYALQNPNSKFICSYEYYLDNGTTARSVLAYHDDTNSQAGRSYLITPFVYNFRNALKSVEQYHKKMSGGEKIKVYYRHEEDDATDLLGTWADTSTFNIVSTGLGISDGDLVLIKMGAGSGQLIRVADVTESSTVTSITLEEANTFATATDVGAIDVLNFRSMGSISDTTQDYHTLNIPADGLHRKTQFLFEFRQAASNEMDLDYAIIP